MAYVQRAPLIQAVRLQMRTNSGAARLVPFTPERARQLGVHHPAGSDMSGMSRSESGVHFLLGASTGARATQRSYFVGHQSAEGLEFVYLSRRFNTNVVCGQHAMSLWHYGPVAESSRSMQLPDDGFLEQVNGYETRGTCRHSVTRHVPDRIDDRLVLLDDDFLHPVAREQLPDMLASARYFIWETIPYEERDYAIPDWMGYGALAIGAGLSPVIVAAALGATIMRRTHFLRAVRASTTLPQTARDAIEEEMRFGIGLALPRVALVLHWLIANRGWQSSHDIRAGLHEWVPGHSHDNHMWASLQALIDMHVAKSRLQQRFCAERGFDYEHQYRVRSGITRLPCFSLATRIARQVMPAGTAAQVAQKVGGS